MLQSPTLAYVLGRSDEPFPTDCFTTPELRPTSRRTLSTPCHLTPSTSLIRSTSTLDVDRRDDACFTTPEPKQTKPEWPPGHLLAVKAAKSKLCTPDYTLLAARRIRFPRRIVLTSSAISLEEAPQEAIRNEAKRRQQERKRAVKAELLTQFKTTAAQELAAALNKATDIVDRRAAVCSQTLARARCGLDSDGDQPREVNQETVSKSPSVSVRASQLVDRIPISSPPSAAAAS